jgi:hypothetical protein
MSNHKSPQEALNEIGSIQNFVLILMVFGCALLSWAAIGYGFAFDTALWFCVLLLASGFWYLCGRFTDDPSRSLHRMMRVVTLSLTALWIAALVATILHWEELAVSMVFAVVLAGTLTALMVRVSSLGEIIMGR